MRYLNYTAISIIILFLFAVSCENTESDDSIPPTISDVVFNRADTVFILNEGSDDSKKKAEEEGRYVILNKKVKTGGELDTIVIGQPLTLSGTLRDEGGGDRDGLSGISVRVWREVELTGEVPEPEVRSDGSLNMRADTITKVTPQAYMFRKKEYRMNKQLLVNVFPNKVQVVQDDLSTREEELTEDSEYYYHLRYIDIAGNEDSVTHAKVPVKVLTYETIKKMYEENKK